MDEAAEGLSFRTRRECCCGRRQPRTGKQGGGWRELEALQSGIIPAPTWYRWAAQDCMTLDGVPYIGPYSARTENLYVATGFNKWGMTSAMAAAMLLTDMVQGKRPDDAPVFSPSRSMLRPQLALNALEAAASLLTPTAPRCPHMGCALKWNAQEHSWDCPCHGSRFTQEGGLIENPAMRDLELEG
ncbi:MAG: FAD-dependent oxidoreductase [Ruthenibacterium lactatiformans]